MPANDTDVIIAGAGPVGLMLAAELRLGGVRVVVLERSTDPTDQTRALGFTSRTIEVFDQRGLLPRFGGFGTIPIGHFGGLTLDYREVPGGSYGAAGVPQSLTSSILDEWGTELGADIRRGWTVTGFDADLDGVSVAVDSPDGPRRLRAAYLVGCDGGRSTVRKLAGIDFPGQDAVMELAFAEVDGIRVKPRPNGERVPGGLVLAFQQGADRFRVTYYERGVVPRPGTEPPSYPEVAAAWLRLTGEDISAGSPSWIGRFTDASRQAAEYRRGRVLLAGDAAHIHLPIGGQGMSTGLQDAVNLGWKLAAEIHGHAPDGLLDTYHSERHPVGARVIRNTLAQRILYVGGPEVAPIRDLVTELTAYADVRRHLINTVTGLTIRYDVGPGEHPLLGCRLPGLDLAAADGPTSTLRLLHRARGVVLVLDDGSGWAEAAAPWAERVDTVSVRPADADGAAAFAGAAALLVRPDGYVAWVGPPGTSPQHLADALLRWFGKPAVG
ncbi:FAD-dependent monooxygenase [Micromonospora fluostatini]|uniref:FAD-dependent monooxygenase n=1 Tax=Micromonospora sp. JCM 30529 TaxID=3421643 RepID=UPI003D184CE5